MNKTDERPLIGIVTTRADEIQQKQILYGILKQAEILNLETAVFSGIFSPFENDNSFFEENSIFDLLASSKLDGFIVIAESFLNDGQRGLIQARLAELRDVPVVIAGGEWDGYVCVNTDDTDDIEALTSHMIEAHGLTEIDILTGPEAYEPSHRRLDGYKRALKHHRLPFRQERIHYGDFWLTSGASLAEDYITGKKPMPQAVVCTNDYMAYGICDRFCNSPYRIPDDIMVIGYEYSDERLYHTPILTCYERNRGEMGAEAARCLYEKMTGLKSEPVRLLTGGLIPGNSCACGINREQLGAECTAARDERAYSLMSVFGLFEQRLTQCKSIAAYIDEINHGAYLIRNVQAIYICLQENWYSTSPPLELGESMVCYYAKGDSVDYYRYYNIPIPFSKSELLPEQFMNIQPRSSMYFLPLFSGKRVFGYVVLTYSEPDGYDIQLRNWMKTTANALEFLRLKQDISYLLMCQNLSAFHDMLTGLYNKVGFDHYSYSAVSQAGKGQRVISVCLRVCIFPRNRIGNEQHSKHIALQAAAEVLKKLLSASVTVCARSEDTTFLLCAVGTYDSRALGALSTKLRTLLFNSRAYSENYGVNSICISSSLEDVQGVDYAQTIAALEKQAEQSADKMRRRVPEQYFSELSAIRDSAYFSPHEELSLTQLCKQLCCSEVFFRSCYKRLFGISFHQDIIAGKILMAQHLLTSTVLDISSVAAKCGYSDEKYFSRIFKKVTGCTPKQYRSGSLFSWA